MLALKDGTRCSNGSTVLGAGHRKGAGGKRGLDDGAEELADIVIATAISSSSFSCGTSDVPVNTVSVRSRKRRCVVLCTLSALAFALLYALSVLRLEIQIKDYAKKNRFEIFPDSVTWYPLDYRRLVLQTPRWSVERGEKESNPMFGFYQITCSSCHSSYTSTRKEVPEVIVFFVHGNAGSYTQAHRLGILLLQDPKIEGRLYSFDFSEQANVHRGALLHRQADFVTDTVVAVYRDKKRAMRKQGVSNLPLIWLVGHSMGGIVARLALSELSESEVFPLIAGVITLNTPHRQMPIFLDPPMQELYYTLWHPVGAGLSTAHQKQRKGPRILSITSGSLDMQVHHELTRLNDSAECDESPCVDVTTEHPAVCGKTFVHDDIVRDYCAVRFWTHTVIQNSLGQGRETGSGPLPPLLQNWSLPAGIGASAPPPRSFSDALSWWAELSYNHISFTVLVTFLYASLTLSAACPLLQYLLERSGMLCHHSSDECRCTEWSWKSLLASSHTAVLLIAPIMGVAGRLLLVQLPCCIFSALEGCTSPWIAETLVCRPTFHPLSLVWCAIAAFGPMLEGIWIGIIGHRLTQLLLMLSEFMWTKLWSFVHHTCVYLRMPQWVRRSSTRGGDDHDEPWKRILPITMFVVIFLLCAVILPLRICDRALAWLCLTYVLLPFSASCQTSVVKANARKRTEAYAMVAVYALVHFIHLQPFFVWRNALRSATFDDATVVHITSCVTEVLLLVLVFLHVVWPLHDRGLLCRQLQRDQLAVLRRTFPGARVPRLALDACVLCVLLPVIWMVSVPVESFRVVWVLLCAFPCFLFGPALVPSGGGTFPATAAGAG